MPLSDDRHVSPTEEGEVLAPCDCSYVCEEDCGHSISLLDPDPIYICNATCSCSSTCPNRLPKPALIFSTVHSPDKGYCLITTCSIPRDTYLGDYTGEVISSLEARARHSLQTSNNYILTVREGSHNSADVIITHIDAAAHGSEFRFMNHSCEPNVRIVPIRDDSHVPRVTCWVSRDVAPGEELCISYGDKGGGGVKCHCGSVMCRGTLPAEEFLPT